MEANLLEFIQGNPHSAYWAVFFVLFACGLGVPIPEDITLLAGGYAVFIAQQNSLGQPQLVPMMIVGMLGVLSGDTILFLMGRWIGPRITRALPFRRMFTLDRMTRVRRFFSRYGVWTAFFARFAPGLRAPTYLLAGTACMHFHLFFLADGAAALISVPLLVWLSYRFGTHIENVKAMLSRSKYAVLGAVLVIVLAIFLRRRRQRAANGSEN